jgi:hypothetical protein
MEQHRRRQFIEGLRAVAQFYETNPDAWYDGMHLTLNMYVWGRAARKALADTARALGQCNKVYDDTNITVARQFSEQVTLAVFAARARVCRRVVLGDRILPARTLPAFRPPGSRLSNGDATLCCSRMQAANRYFGRLKNCVPFLHPQFPKLRYT